jgi:polysaccharide biosynthesis protein PslH
MIAAEIPASETPQPAPRGPLSGKTVAVVHAAWHSCGSYQVNVGQLIAYKALGARVISIALMDVPGPPAPDGGRWPAYLAATRDLPADARFFAGPPQFVALNPKMLLDGWLRLIRGDQASWLVELMRRAPPPAGIESERIDLVHANHYFTLPFVANLTARRPAPVLLETQDIQARQYALRNRGGFFIPPYATYDEMLAVELAWMRRADICVHLNEQEHVDFQKLLPESRHALVYPAVKPAPIGSGGGETVIVASDNYANYESLRWFLEEVLPRANGARVAVYGNIDSGVKSRDAALYERHSALFRGRVEDIGAVYAQATRVLLPTTQGHGLSIKAVEALSSGAPLIATRAAFRGMGVDPAGLNNVVLADDAESFARALQETTPEPTPRAQSDTRRLYDAMFSVEAYAKTLATLAAPLVPA